MHWFVNASLRSRLVVLTLAAVLTVVGIFQLQSMPVDVLPEFSPLEVEIQTESLGLSAVEVEELITSPMEENLLNGVAFVEDIRSTSVPGLSSIVLTFEDGTDLYNARQVVSERLIRAATLLPHVSRPPQMMQPLSSSNRVLMLGLSSDVVSLIDISTLARWTVRPSLLGVSGVANVSVWGMRERQLQVQVDPEQLREMDVSLDQVISTTGNALWVSPLSFLAASSPGTGGFIDTPNQRVGVQHVLPISTPEDLANVALEGSQGSADATGLRLGDVATVVLDHQPLIGDSVVEGSGLILLVEKFPEVDVTDVTRDVEAALAELAPGLTGINVDSTLFRPATYIESATENVSLSLVFGIVVLILMIALMMDWRAALVCAVSICVSVSAAVLVLFARGITLNAMVLAGLVIALVVIADDAISTVDGIRNRAGTADAADSTSRAATIGEAVMKVRATSAYALAVILLALTPIVVLEGVAGSFLPPLAYAYVIAIAVSTLIAVTLTPVLASIVLRHGAPRRESPISRWSGARYNKSLQAISQGRRFIVEAGLLGAAICGLALVPLLDRSSPIVAQFADSDVVVRWDGHPGTSLTEMNRITDLATAELRAVPGVRSVAAHVGRAILADKVAGINAAEIWVSIDPDSDREATLAAVESIVGGYPGIDDEVLTYQQNRIDARFEQGIDDEVRVRLFGESLQVLEEKATEVRDAMASIDGVTLPTVETPAVQPSIEVEVDLAAAQASGIKPGDVRRQTAALLSGIEVGSLFDEQKVFDVVVVGAPETRLSAHDISDTLLATPEGGHIPLGDVAEVRISANPTAVHHQGVSRYLDVSARIDGRDHDDVVADIEQAVGVVTFPLEHHARVIDQADSRASDRWRFVSLAAAAAIGVVLLLQAALASWKAAFAVMALVPTALLGGLIVVAIAGDPVTIGTIAGFIVLFALMSRNALTLIHQCRRLGPGSQDPLAAVHDLARDRLVPTVTSALAIVALMLPIVVGSQEAGMEIIRPMALVVLGGVITTALVSAVVLPALIVRLTLYCEAAVPDSVTDSEDETVDSIERLSHV